jgi:hypothetical protein
VAEKRRKKGKGEKGKEEGEEIKEGSSVNGRSASGEKTVSWIVLSWNRRFIG